MIVSDSFRRFSDWLNGWDAGLLFAGKEVKKEGKESKGDGKESKEGKDAAAEDGDVVMVAAPSAASSGKEAKPEVKGEPVAVKGETKAKVEGKQQLSELDWTKVALSAGSVQRPHLSCVRVVSCVFAFAGPVPADEGAVCQSALGARRHGALQEEVRTRRAACRMLVLAAVTAGLWRVLPTQPFCV